MSLHYQKSRFEADAKFEMLVGLALTLALDAVIKAKAGVGWFSIEREKRQPSAPSEGSADQAHDRHSGKQAQH